MVGAIIAGVASLASGIFGSIAANERRAEAERELEKQKQRLTEWRDAEMGTDYLDRADSRAALRRVFENNKEAQKALNTEAVKSGMTDEAKVAYAADLNENYADTVSQIAGVGAQHKDNVQRQYLSETRNLDNLKIQNKMDTSGVESMVQGITGAAGAIGSLASGNTPGLGGIKRMADQARSNPDFSKVASMASSGTGVPTWADKFKIG